MSMKRTTVSMTDFFRNSEGNLNAALSELKETLESIKKITNDVGAVTGDVKQISNSVANVERRIRGGYDHMKEGLGSAAGAKMAGLKAGIRTGVVTLVRSMHKERSDDHDRGK